MTDDGRWAQAKAITQLGRTDSVRHSGKAGVGGRVFKLSLGLRIEAMYAAQ